MATVLDNLAVPIGAILDWFRPTSTWPLPPGYLICDGSVVSDPAAGAWNGKTLPDYRSVFSMGHPTLTNASFPADTAYYAGGTLPAGGVSSLALGHVHAAGTHVHDLSGHAHGISAETDHAHTMPDHQHTTPQTGSTIAGAGGAADHTAGATGHAHPAAVTGLSGSGSSGLAGAHAHGGITAAAVGSTAAGTGNTASALSTVDSRPPYFGVLKIIRIK